MKFYPLLFLLAFASCNSTPESVPTNTKTTSASLSNSDKIQVLNVGFFHFGYTPDAHSTEFNENSEESRAQIRAVAQRIAEFKPTIICIENLPKHTEKINKYYQNYLKNPVRLDSTFGESSMVGFEVGRLSGVDKIECIDHHMGYNYSVGDFIEQSPDYENSIDSETYLQLTNEPFKDYPEMAKRYAEYDSLDLQHKLLLINEPLYLDHSINSNADKLLYVGIEDGFEGADNAALFYQRNMRIFSNLNRIKMTKNDRVFILMGAAHTAFLREFIERSPKFEMVNTLEFLK